MIGSSYCTAVASSGELMMKSPSPVMQTTSRSGWTSFAAFAAGDPVAHRAAAGADLGAVLRELGEAVGPDREVAGAAGLDRIRGQPPAQEGHDLAEVDGPLHRLVAQVRLVVGARRGRPLAPPRLDRLELAQRRRELRQPGDDRQVGLVDAAELRRVRVGVDERLAAAAAARAACSGASARRPGGRRRR